MSFIAEKRPAIGDRGMVVTNHPRASAAGAEVLLAGGNAIDAAIASLFALTIVEPMMVGVLGGGVAHIRTADGRHHILDGLSTAPAASTATMFAPEGPGLLPQDRAVKGRANAVGALAVAVPGALVAWCEALARFGTMPLADVVAPAIRLARDGFIASAYTADCVSDLAADLARDAGLSRIFLPGGAPIRAGDRIVQGAAADALSLIARDGAKALTDGAIGQSLIDALDRQGGILTRTDLVAYAVAHRAPIVGRYRGHEIIGPPPPAAAGVHVVQMLNILEGYDLAGLGFGTVDGVHLLAEVMKIAFADRAVATGDPAFVDVPVAALIDKAAAARRRQMLRMERAQAWSAAFEAHETAHTTHVTVADGAGNVVASTQTINGLFGACLMVPETGLLTNNYMFNFDPHPGRALSIAPGKRCFTSMAPMMATRAGRLRFALGLPGGLRIFPSAMQAIVNLIDHGMDPQSAVEAPRIWCEGGPVELEPGITEATAEGLAARGHAILRVNRIGGGMGAITWDDDGMMTGASCWRADGTPVAIAGGGARAGVRFSAT